MDRPTLHRLLVTALGGVVVVALATLMADATVMVVIACATYASIAIRLYKFDYLHPAGAFAFPWLMILIFSVIPISVHARPMNLVTYDLLLATVFAWLLGSIWAAPAAVSPGAKAAAAQPSPLAAEFRESYGDFTAAGFAVLFVFAAINVAAAGYVPLLSLITTGDSRYLEFGVPSVYGAFLAYANAIACFAFYIYLRNRRRIYLLLFISVLVMHVVLVTRQNLITLLVEAFVIRSLALGRLSRVAMISCIAFALIGFSLLGTLRSGDAKEIFGVQPEFLWVPTSVIWLYAYSYFNALNIDNIIVHTDAPYFDGFMWQTLLPSVLRPDAKHDAYLEVSSAAASSYIFPVYTDIGKGVVPWTFLLSAVTAIFYRQAVRKGRFVDIASYSCLFFCALMSFFVDFWLYLPVIFQLFFFRVFHALQSRPAFMSAAAETSP